MDSARKVLMLVHTFPPFGSVGGSIRLLKFLTFLKRGKDGWEPTVITIRPDIDLLWVAKESQDSLKQIPEDIRLIRTDTREPKTQSSNRTKLSQLIRKLRLAALFPLRKLLLIPDDKKLWAKYLKRAALDELEQRSYSLIYATAPPFSVLIAAVAIKEKTGLPLVIDIKDDWIHWTRFRGSIWCRKVIESRMERRCISNADKIITVTGHSYERYRSYYPEFKDKFVLIPNGCDISEYKKYWKHPPVKFSKFTLIHTGIFSSKRDLSHLFRALKRIVLERPELSEKIEFIITGKMPSAQSKLVKDLNLLSIVTNIGYMDRDLYVETLVKAHLPVVINYDMPSLVPGKLYEYWGSRNKMLLLDSTNSAASDIVKKYELGYVVAPNDEDTIYRRLCDSYDNWLNGSLELNDVSGLQEFDRESLTRKLESVFNSLVDS